MEQFLSNTRGKPAKRTYADGKWWLVTTAVTIPENGVLHGSQGPGLYPAHETARSTPLWDGMPLTVYHPFDPISGKPVTAAQAERQHVGVAKNSVYKNKLKHEFWFEEDRVKQVSKAIHDALLNGEPMDVSTGLSMQYTPAPANAHQNGVPYSWIGSNYKPDHIAILPTQKGACSIEHGCGMNVNSDGMVINHFIATNKKQKPSSQLDMSADKACKILHDGTVHGQPLTEGQRGMFGAKCGQTKNGHLYEEYTTCLNYDLPPSQFVDNVWTEQARTAAALAKAAYAKANSAQQNHMTQQAGAQTAGGKGGKNQQYGPQQVSEQAYQVSMQAHQRGVASQQDLLHVEYAHRMAEYQMELAAAQHHHAGDNETAQAHRKAAEAHRKAAEQLRKKIDETDTKLKASDKKDKKPMTQNELPHSEIHHHLQKLCDEDHKDKHPDDPYGGPTVHSVFDKHFIYQKRGKWHQQGYKVTKNDKVKLKDEPFEVERKVTYHPVTNAALIEYIPIPTAPAATTGVPMTMATNAAALRQAHIQFLTTNASCSCMKDRISTINELSDKKLAKLVKKVMNEFAQGSFAGVNDDEATQRQMTQIDRITSGKSSVPNTKKHDKQSTDNHPTHMNAADWYASAPPEVREFLQLQLTNANAQKVQIIERLTAHIQDKAQKESTQAIFNKMSYQDLLALNTVAPRQVQLPEGFDILRSMGHFAGAGAPIANAGQQVDTSDDILPLPTHNAYDEEAIAKEQWLKAKRAADAAARGQARA